MLCEFFSWDIKMEFGLHKCAVLVSKQQRGWVFISS